MHFSRTRITKLSRLNGEHPHASRRLARRNVNLTAFDCFDRVKRCAVNRLCSIVLIATFDLSKHREFRCKHSDSVYRIASFRQCSFCRVWIPIILSPLRGWLHPETGSREENYRKREWRIPLWPLLFYLFYFWRYDCLNGTREFAVLSSKSPLILANLRIFRIFE